MSQGSSPSSDKTQSVRHPWRLQRMIKQAKPHINEVTRGALPERLLLAGVGGVMVIAAVFIFFWVGSQLGNQTGRATVPAPTSVPPTSQPATKAVVTPTLAQPGVLATETRPPAPPTLPPTPTSSPSGTRHKVKAGDTLTSIAVQYGVTIQSIMTANNLKNDMIRIGDELVIPSPR